MNEGISISIEPIGGPPKNGPSPRFKYPVREGNPHHLRGMTLKQAFATKPERKQSNG